MSKVLVEDKEGNIFWVYSFDPRYVNGELKQYNKGKPGVKWEENRKITHSNLMKDKQKDCGFVKNTIWINNGVKSKRINKILLEDYIELGWTIGRLKNVP